MYSELDKSSVKNKTQPLPQVIVNNVLLKKKTQKKSVEEMPAPKPTEQKSLEMTGKMFSLMRISKETPYSISPC